MNWGFCRFWRALGWSEDEHCCPELIQISPNLNSLAFRRHLENLCKPHQWISHGLFAEPMKYKNVGSRNCKKMPEKSRYDESKTKCSPQCISLTVTYDFLAAQVHKLLEELQFLFSDDDQWGREAKTQDHRRNIGQLSKKQNCIIWSSEQCFNDQRVYLLPVSWCSASHKSFFPLKEHAYQLVK